MLSLNKIFIKKKIECKKIILYIFISVLSFGLDFGITKIAISMGAMLFFANTIGWIIGAFTHVKLISNFVFGKSSISLPIILVYVINFIANPSLATALIFYQVDILISKICALLIMFILNYYLFNKLFSKI